MNSMLIRNLSSGVEPSSIIHGFDMDDTLLTTASGKTFATSAADWKLWHSDVPAKVQAAHAAGAKIVIFTNQMGISKGKLTAAAFKARCDALIATLGVPVQVFAATEEDVYRKPSTRMWEYMEEHGNGTKKVDRSQSLYIGDAGGRTRNPTTGKKDFSCSDRKFAHNVGVKFNTPEMYFQGRSDDAFEWGSVDPAAAMAAQKALPLFTPATPPLVSGSVEVIVLVGFPASGKSTFSKRHLVPHGYVHVNQDTAGTKEKCVKMCREALEQKKPVVIDNTNASRDLRNLYITLAKDFGVPARCFHFQTSQDLAEHLNIFRVRTLRFALH
eukprot:TRINITY_DN3977_c0_g1_i2.p1 TRINITY_DN3977_c0_g1~~TRINITY_DN3977_c0_g1_i2.p1  ORF type:complete len:359 (+),score=83.75 TRINITY_DN3977_c0_g1_i2:99-1079(+)